MDTSSDEILSEEGPDGRVTKFTYDSSGNITSVTDPGGNTITNTWNSFDEPLDTTNALGVTTTRTYNSHGDLISISQPVTKSLTATGAEIYSWYTKKLASMGWKFGNDGGCPDWAVTCPQYYHAGHGNRELFVIAIDDPTSDPFGIPPSKIPPACTVYDMSYQIFSPGGTSVNIPSMGWNGGTQCWWTKKGWRFPPDAVDAAT